MEGNQESDMVSELGVVQVQVAMMIRQNEPTNDNYLEKVRLRGTEMGIVSPAQLMISIYLCGRDDMPEFPA